MLKDYWAIIIAIAAAIASASVALYRIGEVESEVRGQPLRVAVLERQVDRLGCEIDNIKKLLKNLPEVFCR
jgi:hypothetical protein